MDKVMRNLKYRRSRLRSSASVTFEITFKELPIFLSGRGQGEQHRAGRLQEDRRRLPGSPNQH
jgi:hypothetical protein